MHYSGGSMHIVRKSKRDFSRTFAVNERRLRSILGDMCAIEHIGSTAVPGVDGKGIIDILIGFDDSQQINQAIPKLLDNNYFRGRNPSSRKDRIFMASSMDDTKRGDIHLHLVLRTSKDFYDFIAFRDYLRHNPKEAKKYSDLKYRIIEEVGDNREEYKKRKSHFIEAVLHTK